MQKTKERLLIFLLIITAISVFGIIHLFPNGSNTVYADVSGVKKAEEYSAPNDPYFSKQWTLSNENCGMSVQQAWEITTGSNRVAVGVMDTGIAVHEDLETNINRTKGYRAFRFEALSNDTTDIDGHGTMVAGIIGAVTNNGIGVAGISPSVEIIPLKISRQYSFEEDAVLRAIDYAKEHDIKILNFSFAGFGLNFKILNAVREYPGLFIWSAGNSGENVDEFENIEEFNLPNLISVGARDKNNQRSYWVDEYGSTGSSAFGKAVDIFAPGGTNTDLIDLSGLIYTTNKDNKYAENFKGTSAAAPHVAGVAALLLSIDPFMTGAELKQAIIDGSDMIEIDTPVGKQKVRNLNAYGALHSVWDFETKTISDTEVAITGVYDVKSERLMIPATYNGKKVVAIGDNVFRHLKMLKSVIISESVTSIGKEAFAGSSVEKVTFFRGEEELKIGNRAFADCDYLSDIIIPNRTVSIGYQAFADCDSLNEASFASGVLGNLEIGWEAFKDCRNIISANIPAKKTVIGDGAFSGCSKLNSFKIPTIIKSLSIGANAFENCYELKEMYIPEGADSIGDRAFVGCSNLQKVEIENSFYNRGNFTIGDRAFSGCGSLTYVDIPGQVTQIGNSCFQGCVELKNIFIQPASDKPLTIGDSAFYNTGLTSIKIPYRTSRIGNNAFAECSELTDVKFLDGTNKINIGSNAFYNCKKLVSVSIPNTVGSIGVGAFRNCSALSEITLWADFTEISDDLFNGCSALEKVTIYGKTTKIGNYAFSQCTSLTDIDLGDYSELQTIGDHAFDSTLIVAIDIPDGVTTIGNNAFAWCTRLSSVGISRDSGLTSIGDHAFDNTAISEIYLPDTVTSIGKFAFRNCEFLTSVTLPKDIESIENGVFSGCANLTEAVIPSGVTSIGESAFGSCEKLDNVVLPSGLKFIWTGAFEKCKTLSEIVIPKGVEIIDHSAFSDCKSLTDIIIPNTVTQLGESVFRNCSALEGLFFELGSSLLYIPDGMCCGCTALERVNIPSGAKEIGVRAFSDCYRLKYAPIGADDIIEEIWASAFYNCAFTEVVLPRTLQSLAYDTFDSCYMLQKIHITNTTNMMQIVGEADDLVPLIDLPVLDGIYVYDVQLAMEYKNIYDTLADYIVTVGFDWALVTDSDEISDRYLFDYVFNHNRDAYELINVVENEVVNGVLFYLTGNDVYDMSCYAEICCYDIPVIVITPGSVTEEMPYTIIKADDYSLGYGIAKSYIDGLYDYAGVYLYDILIDKECFPVIVPQSYRYNLSFLMGMSHVFGMPVKAVERYDELYDWKNENDVCFENWLCFIDSTNADIVKLTFNNNIGEYYVSCGFSYSRQYLSEFEYKFVIKNTSVITDIAEKHILGESYDFVDYTFDVDTEWIESNISTDYDHVIIDWYENEWMNDSYNALTQEDIESQKERYADILEFYADKSAYINDNNVCYIARTVTYIDPYM